MFRVNVLTSCIFNLTCLMSLFQGDKDNYTVTSASNTAVSYQVDMSISCCTCPAGVTGGLCKHQSAVARIFGHSEGGLLLGLPPETRKLYYQMATGVFVFRTTKQLFECVLITVSFPTGTCRNGH